MQDVRSGLLLWLKRNPASMDLKLLHCVVMQ
jgi:hypothetical protein